MEESTQGSEDGLTAGQSAVAHPATSGVGEHYPQGPQPGNGQDHGRTLSNIGPASAAASVEDICVVGDPDSWKLIAKAWSNSEGWMKSTKGLQISGTGVLVQVTTERCGQVAEALCFVPGATLAKSVINFPPDADGQAVESEWDGTWDIHQPAP